MITVKDIRDKEFTRQKRGYNEDEVDDFLDEIADQLEALVRENRSMMEKVEAANAEKAKAEAALAQVQVHPAPASYAPESTPAPVAEPAKVDDSSYFKNLEAALRETLISAQRIADETVTEAKKKAEQAIDDAQKHATSLRASAKAETDELLAKAKAEAESLRTGAAKDAETAKAEFENLRAKNEAYRAKFKSILEEQLKLFTGGDDEE